MDLLKILDAKPEPELVDEEHFAIDDTYQNSNDYKIATPMSDFQKELMDQIVSLHYSDILKFFERVNDSHATLTPSQERIIVDSLHTMLDNAQLVASHPYLLIDHYFPKSLTNRDLPKRLAETGGKFQVLRNILEILDTSFNPQDKNDHTKDHVKPVHLGIVAKAGKTLDLIDSLCTGSKCVVERYSGVKVRDSGSHHKKYLSLKLNVHLFPSSMEDLHEKELTESKGVKFDYLVLFDITGDLKNEKLAEYIDPAKTKVLRLVPIYSVDHIALYYRDLANERNYEEYLKPVVAAVSVMRDRVGQLPPLLKPIYSQDMRYLTRWFQNPMTTKWPLPDMPPIPSFNGKDVERSLLTEVKFNFDNDDFLKEEEEAQPKELNLNFSFASGKTQMIGHIVQPRYMGKDQNKMDYYEEKRWQKKYLTNPLNTDYYKLTGISREATSTEVLTHTLMYDLIRQIDALERTNVEVKTFDQPFDARMNDFRVMRKEFSKMSLDLSKMEGNVSDKTNEIKRLDGEMEKCKQRLGVLKESITSSVESSTGATRDWLVENEAKVEVEEEMAKKKSHMESNANEDKYMRQEIERAEKSITESREAIAKKQEKLAELQEKISSLKGDRQGINERKEKLKHAKVQLEKAHNRQIELADTLDLTLKRVVDASTGRSRYVNYSRGR